MIKCSHRNNQKPIFSEGKPSFEHIESRPETEPTARELTGYDQEYFEELEGKDGWNAHGQENCKNQQYFTVTDTGGERLGIIGVYDTDDEQNVTHTVVDPKHRGQGLAEKFKNDLMDRLDLPFVTLTIDLDNAASIRAAEKLPGIRRASDAEYEKEFHKAKFIYEKPRPGDKTFDDT